MADARVLCTLAAGSHAELYEIARPTFERYAVRHGYDLVAQLQPFGPPERPLSWHKIVLVRELLERYGTVVWIDSDAVIVDPTDDIAARLEPRRSIHLVFHEVAGVTVPNAGVFVIERSRRSIRLLERVWSRTEFLHHRWWENAALIAELGGDGDVGLVGSEQIRRARRTAGRLPLRWNSIPPCRSDHPAIVHFAGESHRRRVEGMTALVDRVSSPP